MVAITDVDTDYLRGLAAGASGAAEALLARTADEVDALAHRPAMWGVKTAVVAFAADGSPLEGRGALVERAFDLVRHLERSQLPGGLFDSENLASPPDTGFTVNDGCLVLAAIRRLGDPRLDVVADGVRGVLARTIQPMLAGGVHTPNHRWELASALVSLHAEFGDDRLLDRAATWLAEGIDQQRDGLYSERSPNYAAHVTNPALIDLARHLDAPGYLDVVRRNLRATLRLTDRDLDVETVQSRRQDQDSRFDGRVFLSQFRRFAITDGDAAFASIVARILDAGAVDPEHHLALALADPVLAGSLPAAAADESAEGAVLLEPSGLGLVVAGSTRASVFGGSDVPRTGRIASGLANSAVLARFRMGDAVVDAVRLSHDFFGLGPFRADRIAEVVGGFELGSAVAAGYHQPLPVGERRDDGDYALEPEPRFFAAMSFSCRETELMSLRTRATVRVVEDAARLDWSFDGTDTSWTIEVVLRPGGELTGVEVLPDGGHLLVDGYARYAIGDTVLEVGPGNGSGPRRPARYDPGELVTAVGGSDAIDGVRLLVTGRTDAGYGLTFTASRRSDAA